MKPDSIAGEAIQEKALDGALRLASANILVFPCRNAPGEDGHKAPLTPHGFKDATTDRRQIEDWWGRYPDALIGMPTGAINGIAVLDLDKKNDKDGFAAVPGWKCLSNQIAMTGGGGAHIYFQANRPIRSTTGKNGVDVRGEGGYVIAPPSAGYFWATGNGTILPSALPTFPAAYLPSLHVTEPSAEGLLADDPALVAAALLAIPNDDEDWEFWNRVGMAAWGATEGDDEGLEAWDEWSRKSDKYSPSATERRWRHFFRSPPTQIGFGSLFYMASEADPGWLDRFERAREAVARASFEEGQAAFLELLQQGERPGSSAAPVQVAPAPEDGAGAQSHYEPAPNPASLGGDAEQPPVSQPVTGRVGKPQPVVEAAGSGGTVDDASTSLLGDWDAGGDDEDIPPRSWLLGNTYCRQFVSSLLATGGGGKTATRILQALACATGRNLTGETVFQRCRVLYVSLEDDRDELRRRVRAARIHHNITSDELKGYLFLAAPGQKAGKLVTSEPAARGRKTTDGRVGPVRCSKKCGRRLRPAKLTFCCSTLWSRLTMSKKTTTRQWILSYLR